MPPAESRPEPAPVPRIPELLDLYRLRAKGSPVTLLRALERTWEAPAAFHAELVRHSMLRTVRPLRSIAGDAYDPYHDAVLRHTGEARAALRWFDAERTLREMTFGELHARAGRLAEVWAGAGAAAGAVVAIVMEPGPERVVALFAGLRLGLTVSILPARGDQLTGARLAALKPAHICIAPHHAWLAGPKLAKAILPESDDQPPAPEEFSASYPAAAPCLLLFSPCSKDPLAPTAVSAHDAYLGALRDAALAYGIGPGDAMAAPGADDLQHQPSLVLAALLAGATWCEYPLEVIDEDPRRLRERPLMCLGVPRALREVLLGKPVDLSGEVEHIWTPLDDCAESERLDEMRRAIGLGKEGAASVHVDAALGGAVLVSSSRYQARYDAHHCSALPAAGLSFSIEDPSGGGKGAVGVTGVLSVGVSGKGLKTDLVPTTRLLMRREGDWFDLGHTEPRRAGRTFPAAHVEKALADLPFVTQVVTAPLPSPGSPYPHDFTLLIFVGPRPAAEIEEKAREWEDLIREAARRRVGDEHVPDRVEIYALYARRGKKGVVDADWARSQRGSGGLRRRETSRAQRLLCELRSAAVMGHADAATFTDTKTT